MINGIRCRAYPTPDQQKMLAQWIGCARVIYNAKVAEMEYFQTFRRKALGAGPMPEIDQAYSQFKCDELTPFLSEVPSQLLRNSSFQFMTAWQRYRKGLAARPAHKQKGRRDSVLLTSELFRFDEQGTLNIGTFRHKVGDLKFGAHREFNPPKTLVISRKADRWYVSFCFDDPVLAEPRSQEEILADLSHLSAEQLISKTWAGDRGVREMLHGSDGQVFHLAPDAIAKHKRREQRKKHLQRKLARQKKGSRRRSKTKLTISRISTQQAEVRKDFAHQVSRKLVNNPAIQVFTFEDLKIANMTRRAKPKQDETGQYLPNGAAAKTGLNRSILQSCWGNITLFTHYKAARMNKVSIKVPAQFSSQTCSKCGHTSAKNRAGKRFLCTGCGFACDADFNASLVLRGRGVSYVLNQDWKAKKAPKKVAFRKKTGLGTRP
ncbi:RNA-guided endonuclease InsQ/TnpB family protein [Pseudomonas sp. PLMAX]|uniref:RNA-guided endonuclease InsQ/TnpB family protein n=1 Tax=Pseudomonas sp. PLMAX TaxID=2201998 RepID=UPI0038BD6376